MWCQFCFIFKIAVRRIDNLRWYDVSCAMGFYQISNRDIGSNNDKVINDTKDVVENIVLLHDDGSLK